MQKINSLNPFLSKEEANEQELKKESRKNSNLSKDKIYFFRTSLFSEKSKNFIQRMNSSGKKLNKNNEVKIIPKINKETRIAANEKNEGKETNIEKSIEKIVFREEKPKIQKREETPNNNKVDNLVSHDDKNDIKIKEKVDANSFIVNNKYNSNTDIISNINLLNNTIKQSNTSKSTSNLMNIDINNKYTCKLKTDNKSKTDNKKDNISNNENCQKINYKIINNMKKSELFTPISNQIDNINRNVNNKSIVGNYIYNNQSIINNPLPSTNFKPVHLSQNKELKISEGNKKIKYKLKSIKNPTKGKYNNNNINNNLAVSLKSICDNKTMKKEMNNYKSISKHCNIQSFSIFNDNYHISRYKLGKYLAKRNIRYQNKNVLSEDKFDIKKFIKNGVINNKYA